MSGIREVPSHWAERGRTGALLDCGHWQLCNPRLKFRVCAICNGRAQCGGSGRHEVRQVTHVFDGSEVSEYRSYMAAHRTGHAPRLARQIRKVR